MSDLISREAAVHVLCEENINRPLDSDRWLISDIYKKIEELPTIDAVEVVRCKDCIHQQKVFHEDKRIKEGGYYICGCELADGYSVVCLDGDFCSRGERRTDE